MAPSQGLADALQAFKALQDHGTIAIRSTDLADTHRAPRLKTTFLHEVHNGWSFPARHDQRVRESAICDTSRSDFCATYPKRRFGDA